MHEGVRLRIELTDSVKVYLSAKAVENFVQLDHRKCVHLAVFEQFPPSGLGFFATDLTFCHTGEAYNCRIAVLHIEPCVGQFRH